MRHLWSERLGLGETDTIEKAIDIRNFYPSTEWDLMSIPGKKNIIYYTCCKEPYPDITFNLTIQRKTLFYTINLLVPCLSINMLTCLTLYLPSAGGEKMSLCITILLSLSMFQMLLLELIPATSLKVPLMGKYILFTMVFVSLSVILSVFTLNANFRSSATHEMPNCTRKLFLDILPRLLFMNKPEWYKDPDEFDESYHSEWNDPENDLTRYEVNAHVRENHAMSSQMDAGLDGPYQRRFPPVQSTFIGADLLWKDTNMAPYCAACAKREAQGKRYPLHVEKALEGIQFIEKHHKDDDENTLIVDEWTYTALVIDRMLFWTYLSVCTVGGASILLNAPMLYTYNEPIKV